YTSEAVVSAQSNVVGKSLGELLKFGDSEVIATAVLRGTTRMSPFPDLTLKQGDSVILEGSSAAIDRVVSNAKLQLGKPLTGKGQSSGDLISIEAIISQESPLAGLSARDLALSYTRGVNLLAVSRRGERLSQRLLDLTLIAGDVIVLQGQRNALPGVMQ